ncbi:hypothetical protein Tco_0490460 [Tanacetum coccineum]
MADNRDYWRIAPSHPPRDQDSLKFRLRVDGNFFGEDAHECLKNDSRSKFSKFGNSRKQGKKSVCKVEFESHYPEISPDVAALTTEVSELKNMMKTMLIDKQKAQAPVPVKTVEQSCVTCGGTHSYRNCPATDGNILTQDPSSTLILGTCFLRPGRALIDVYEGELTLQVGNDAITYNLDQTLRYSVNYNDMTANRIDVVELACEEYSQEVLGFSDVIASGNPTPGYDPIVSNSSPTLTPFGDSDFLLLEEADAFLALADDPTSLEVDESYYDLEGDIHILEALLNTKTAKSSIDEPPEVELKDLPPHLEYAFLEDNSKLPVIIAKDLSVDEKAALIKVLKSRKQAIAWKLSDIKGINPEFCSHKILMERTFEQQFPTLEKGNPKDTGFVIKERV